MADYTAYIPAVGSTTYPTQISNFIILSEAIDTEIENARGSEVNLLDHINLKLNLSGGTLSGSLTLSSGNITIDTGNLVVTAGTITIGSDTVAVKDAALTDTYIVSADASGRITTSSGIVAANIVERNGTLTDGNIAVVTTNNDIQTTGIVATNIINISARNKVQNQDPLSQGTSSRAGMESLLGTNTSGVDTTTGDFGYLKWTKDRNNIQSHTLSDSVRGDFYLSSDSTAVEIATVPTITTDDVTWTFQTTKRVTGTTNRNKSYTSHYNPDINFSIIGYEGDGADGHEIPHHLGVTPELSIFKNRDSVIGWIVKSSLFDKDAYIQLDLTNALLSNTDTRSIASSTVLSIGGVLAMNGADNIISYHFASKSGVCKIGKYIGTGAAGNYVSTEVDGGDAFKPQFVMIKNLTTAQNWITKDSIRGNRFLYPNVSDVEASSTGIEFDNNGIFLSNNQAPYNALNDEYIFMAFAETNIDATKAWTDYDYPTSADTLSIAQDTLVSLANGFNANGQVDTQFQFGSGITSVYGAGHENKQYYIYTSKTGVLGVSEVRPLSGITRNDADKYGVVSPSDKTLRTTSKHFDYESDSGIVLASGNLTTYYAWNAFNKFNAPYTSDLAGWTVSSTTLSWLQYKHSEKRVLKSWRLREGTVVIESARRFTIEGSNDGYSWTAIDSTYTASDYVGNGSALWGDLHDTSANTIAYLYHRINITANNGDATYTSIHELEFNTILATDYFLIEEGVMYDSTGAPIERMYLGEFRTDSAGDIINETIINYPIAEQEVSSLTVHEDLIVYGEANHRAFVTAWVNFDGTQNPPLIRDSFNVKDIVDLGAGHYKIIFETPMDNIGYGVIASSLQNDGSSYLRSFGVDATSPITINSIVVLNAEGHTTAATTPTDANYLNVQIFGGKEIK